MKSFQRDGLRFEYPPNWLIEVAEDDVAWNVQVKSPQTAFFLLSIRPDIADSGELANLTLEAMRTEYKDLDFFEVFESMAGQPAIGHDIDFIAVDITSFTMTRCLNGPTGSVLCLAQTTDYDREYHEPMLRAILASLTIVDEEIEEESITESALN